MSWTNRFRHHPFFEEDKGDGSGGGTGDGPGKQTDDQKKESDDKKKDEKPDDKKPDPKDEKKFTQADLDKQIADRLKREQDANEKKNKEKAGEFEKLYLEVNPKLEQATTELETERKRNETLSGLLESNLQSQISGWPKELKDAYPSKAPIEDRLDWASKMTPVAARLGGQKPPVNGEHNKGKSGEGNLRPESGYMNRYTPPVIPGQTK